MIKNGNDPQSVCKSLTKCSTENLNLPLITGCDVCKAVVGVIKFELTIGNVTLQLIIKAVEELCAVLGDVPVYKEVFDCQIWLSLGRGVTKDEKLCDMKQLYTKSKTSTETNLYKPLLSLTCNSRSI